MCNKYKPTCYKGGCDDNTILFGGCYGNPCYKNNYGYGCFRNQTVYHCGSGYCHTHCGFNNCGGCYKPRPICGGCYY